MADFCQQCSIQIFGEDFGDLAKLFKAPTKYCHTICEGCGDAVVDEEGKCHSDHCLKKHGDVGPFNREAG